MIFSFATCFSMPHTDDARRAWPPAAHHSREHQLQKLKDLIAAKELIVAPVVFNPIMAKMAEEAGFKAIYLSGWQVAALAGFRAGFPFSVFTTDVNIPQGGGLLIQNRADFNGKNLDQAFLKNRQQIPGGIDGRLYVARRCVDVAVDVKLHRHRGRAQ